MSRTAYDNGSDEDRSPLYPPASHNPRVSTMSDWQQRVTTAARNVAAVPMSSARRRKLVFSYAPDWLITIGLSVLFFFLNDVDGYRREFSLADTSLRHTYAIKERVPDLALYLICFAAPLVLQAVINFFTIRSWWDFHNGSLGLILGLALTGSVTQFSKITVGRPRPDVISRCQPVPGSVDPIYGLSTSAICTQTDRAIMRDGFRSFPSGHSSLSFAGLGFLSFYLAGKLHLFDKRGHAGKAWLALAPLSGAALVAISRTMDYRHHWHDVLVGSLLGLTLSYFSYRQYYPSLESELSHRPYSPRIKAELEELLPTHHHRPSHEGGITGTRPEVRRRRSDELSDDGLEGTVQRPEPDLEQLWKDGQDVQGREAPQKA